MSTEPDREFTELDAPLARLPEWRPPTDFAVRLAAAAARQAAEPLPRPQSTRDWLWASVVRRLPLALGSGLLALALLALPWAQLAGSAQFPWWVAGCAAVSGVVLTLRVIRAP
jgi:hypothetical protein